MKQYFSFQWHITDECDQRCRHCYIFSEDNGKKLDAMTWAQIEDTFYNCLDFCEMYNRQPYFYITGGDPILHPDFWKLLSLMKEHEIPFTILGNPFHLNDAVCRKLKEYGCQKYQLSLDGMRETHDWFRKLGSFDAALEKISCIKNAGIRSVVMTTVSGTNIEEIPDIIDTVVARKADVFAFARYCPTSDEKDTGIEPMRYRRLLADCDKKFKEYERKGCETYFNKKDHLWTLYEYETGAFRIPETIEEGMIYGGCNCGNCHLTILPTGDIFACRRARNSKVGNESGRKKIFFNQTVAWRAAGFIYTGERFQKYFLDFEEKYHFHDMYSGGFYPYSMLEEHWAYWSRYIYINRYMDAPKPVYGRLFQLVRDKDYFVLTTNVDHCFQKAGFDKERLFYTQGDYGLFQCSEPCCQETFENEEIIRQMMDQQNNMRIPTELLPICPRCGKPLTMNLRSDNKFVEDEGWHLAAERYNNFIRTRKNSSPRTQYVSVVSRTTSLKPTAL